MHSCFFYLTRDHSTSNALHSYTSVHLCLSLSDSLLKHLLHILHSTSHGAISVERVCLSLSDSLLKHLPHTLHSTSHGAISVERMCLSLSDSLLKHLLHILYSTSHGAISVERVCLSLSDSLLKHLPHTLHSTSHGAISVERVCLSLSDSLLKHLPHTLHSTSHGAISLLLSVVGHAGVLEVPHCGSRVSIFYAVPPHTSLSPGSLQPSGHSFPVFLIPPYYSWGPPRGGG